MELRTNRKIYPCLWRHQYLVRYSWRGVVQSVDQSAIYIQWRHVGHKVVFRCNFLDNDSHLICNLCLLDNAWILCQRHQHVSMATRVPTLYLKIWNHTIGVYKTSGVYLVPMQTLCSVVKVVKSFSCNMFHVKWIKGLSSICQPIKDTTP